MYPWANSVPLSPPHAVSFIRGTSGCDPSLPSSALGFPLSITTAYTGILKHPNLIHGEGGKLLPHDVWCGMHVRNLAILTIDFHFRLHRPI